MPLVVSTKWHDATLRLFLCDDIGVLRRRLLVELERHPDLLVVGEAADVRSVLGVAEHAPCDVVVTGNMIPPIGAARVLAGVRVHSPAAVGVVLGVPTDDDEVVAAVRQGALAFVPRASAITEGARVVRRAALGLPVLPPTVVQALLAEFDRLAAAGPSPAGAVRPPRPSDAERRVLDEVATGASWAAIGGGMAIPPESAARLAANALGRLVRHQEVVAAAVEAGLLAGATAPAPG